MPDTFQARIDDFDLLIETLDDNIEKAIVRYEFPYRKGALLDDLGQKARTVRIRCYWYDDTYDTHKAFLDHLDKNERFELAHPKYGLMRGAIESISVRHDDRQQTAEIDLSFVQELISSPTVSRRVSVERAAEEGFTAGQYELIEEFDNAVRDELGPEGTTITAKILDPELPILPQFTGISTRARALIKIVDDSNTQMDGDLPDVTNPADSLLAMIDYPSTLGGITIASVALAMERYAVLYDPLRPAPVRYTQSLQGSLNTLVPTSGIMVTPVQIASAQRQALQTAYIFETDEGARETVKRLEETPSFDVLGNYIKPEEPSEIMTINDIESILAAIRTDIQAAVEIVRRMESLKSMALALLVHANDIKLERDKIITVETNNVLPLHLICLAYNLPYNYAQRIHSINRIKKPSFTPPGEVRIYAR